ncbi:MAG: ABC transporter ATP-binding protein [Firmicutes bacterium]|nr:ABC transporter ATP-binding protein [Bacillota bacterium]
MSDDRTRKKSNEEQGRGPGTMAAAHGKIRLDKNSVKLFARLMSFMKGRELAMLAVSMALMIVTALVSVRSSTFTGSIIDDYIKPLIGSADPDLGPLLKAIMFMGCLYVISIIVNFLLNRILVDVSNNVLKKIRITLFRHMQKLPIKYFDNRPYGDVMSIYTNDVDNIRELMGNALPNMFSSMITVITIFIAMVRISLALTGVVIATVVVMYLITIFLGGASAKYFSLRQKSLGQMNAYAEELLNGIKVVKVFCHEEQAKAGFDVRNEDLFVKTAKANRLANALMPVMVNIGNLQYVVLAMVGGAMAVSGSAGMTLGKLAAFLLLSRNFTRPVSMISQQINTVVMALAGAGRVFELIDEKPEVDEGKVTLVREDGKYFWKSPDGTLTELKGDIRMHKVDFSYTGDKLVLEDIDLFAKPGQKIAFVGSTGAGKTTITNLINRFYDVADGGVTYDGININDIKKDDLRRSLGMVLQETNLFTGTIADNIRFGRPDATDEEVIAAAKLANAHDFIEKLPEGYDTVINGTGSQLSQGQCQLLSIARCAVADPPVMILDEATSSVDTRTEVLIQRGMDALMHGRTTFVIAHRLSTVMNSNAILVLEKGRIIERGDHNDLLAQKGKYYQLYTGKTE